jgi:hypothetical protein
MIIDPSKLQEIDPLAAQFANPGILYQKMREGKVATAPVRGTESDPWNGANTPSEDAKPNNKSGQIDPGYGKVGMNFGLAALQADPALGLVANGAYDVATGNPNAANNTASGLLGLGGRALTAGVPAAIPGVAMLAESAQRNPNYGRAGASSIGSMIGSLLGAPLGPLGAFAGSVLGGGAAGSSYKDGRIGDMLNTRSGEKIREDVEKSGGSYKESASLVNGIDKSIDSNPMNKPDNSLGGLIGRSMEGMWGGGGKGNDNAGPDGTASAGPESASSDDGETMAA